MQLSATLQPAGPATLVDRRAPDAGPPAWTIRPLGPQDRELVAAGFSQLSRETVRRRFLSLRSRLTDAELDAITGRTPGVLAALGAVDARGRLIGVARVGADEESKALGHIGVVVADSWQGRGVGRALLTALAAHAAAAGFRQLRATMLAENAAIRHMLVGAGAHDWHSQGGGVLEATVDLGQPRPVRPSPCPRRAG
jgi:GNAT superfamily N-acetyltransferase